MYFYFAMSPLSGWRDDFITRFHWLKHIHSLVDKIFAFILASSESNALRGKYLLYIYLSIYLSIYLLTVDVNVPGVLYLAGGHLWVLGPTLEEQPGSIPGGRKPENAL